MGTAKATRAADKAHICRKLVTALHKLYGRAVPKIELPVIETLLFAVCLEDNQWAPAEAGLKKIQAGFFDMNEVRVSSVSELELHLAPLRFADWKGMRLRSILRHVFETTYSYEFEKLRRQTLEQALKTLKKFQDVTPFIRDFVLHEILGSHIVVLDTSMLTTAKWLGLVPWNSDHDSAAEFLRGGIKKSEVSEFCHLLRSLATDPKFIPRFTDPPDHELSMHDVMDRYVELQNPPKRKPKPPAPVEPPKVEKAAASKASAAASKAVAAPSRSASVSVTKPTIQTASTSGKPLAAKTPAAPATKPVATTTVKPTTGTKPASLASAPKSPTAKPVTKSPVVASKSMPAITARPVSGKTATKPAAASHNAKPGTKPSTKKPTKKK